MLGKNSFFKFELDTVLRITCSIRDPGQDYGQNSDFWDLLVNSSPWLRSKYTFKVAYTSKVPDDLQLTANHQGLLLET